MPGPEFRFVHAADLHLDTPFASIGRVAPEIADRLRDASLEAYDALVGMAIEREAAFMVIAAHGNHDPLDGWSAVRRAPDNLVVFGAEAVEAHPVVRGGETLAQVYGISY